MCYFDHQIYKKGDKGENYAESVHSAKSLPPIKLHGCKKQLNHKHNSQDCVNNLVPKIKENNFHLLNFAELLNSVVDKYYQKYDHHVGWLDYDKIEQEHTIEVGKKDKRLGEGKGGEQEVEQDCGEGIEGVGDCVEEGHSGLVAVGEIKNLLH